MQFCLRLIKKGLTCVGEARLLAKHLVGRGFAYENSVWTTRQRANGEAAKQRANGEAARQCVNSEAAG